MKQPKNRKRDEGGLLYQDRAILNLLLEGKTRPEIVRALNMPLGTVNGCCTRLFRELGCKNVVELVLKCKAGQAAL